MRHLSVVLSPLLSTCLCAVAWASETPLVELPLVARGAVVPSEPGLGRELTLHEERAEALLPHAHVTIDDVALPNGERVALELERVRLEIANLELRVDGELARLEPTPLESMWRGKVRGDEHSSVYLAFSPLGSRGWVQTAGETWHLLAGADESDWTNARSQFVAESALLRFGQRPNLACPTSLQPGALTPTTPTPVAPPSGIQALQSPVVDLIGAKIAFETDFQLYQRFNDVAAEQTYLLQLLTSISSVFDSSSGIVFDVVYLGLHTQANDGWTAPDVGGGTGALLDEFRIAWGGAMPNGAKLAHFLSGVPLGGGLAYLDVICNQYWGFAVSCDLNTSLTFPAMQGPLTWDFFVTAHEAGHNFGSPHTHEYCPPIDSCSSGFGTCQTSQSCSTSGTIMSYCHTCGSGMNNIVLDFHPTVAAVMRTRAEASCLPVVCAAPQQFCSSSPNTYDIFGAQIGYEGTNRITRNDLTLVTTSVPPGAAGIYYCGPNTTFQAFGNGFRCIGGGNFRLPIVQSSVFAEAAYAVDLSAPPFAGTTQAGTTWNFQLWYRNPAAGGAGFNLSDGLRVQFWP